MEFIIGAIFLSIFILGCAILYNTWYLPYKRSLKEKMALADEHRKQYLEREAEYARKELEVKTRLAEMKAQNAIKRAEATKARKLAEFQTEKKSLQPRQNRFEQALKEHQERENQQRLVSQLLNQQHQSDAIPKNMIRYNTETNQWEDVPLNELLNILKGRK